MNKGKRRSADAEFYINGKLIPIVPGSLKVSTGSVEIAVLATKIRLAEKADTRIALHILVGTAFLALLFGPSALLLLLTYNVHRIRLYRLEDRLAKLKEAG